MPTKKQVEALLKTEITDELFEEGLERAIRHQERNFESSKDTRVMTDWYLLQLVYEEIQQIWLSSYFNLRNMQKEHQSKAPALSTDSHIVAESII